MLDDAILGVSDVIDEPVPVLKDSEMINSYHDYLAVNYNRIHRSSLISYTNFPSEGQTFRRRGGLLSWTRVCGNGLCTSLRARLYRGQGTAIRILPVLRLARKR